MSEEENKIKINLTLLNGTGYIFNVDDYMELRMKHRIVGTVVGTGNSKGWRPQEATMPVELSHWETQLLIEEKIAVVVSKTDALSAPPTQQQIEINEKEFEANLMSQANALKAQKLRDSETYVEKILEGKRNKLLKQGMKEQAETLTACDVLKQIADDFKFDRQNALIAIPRSHPIAHTAKIYKWPYDNSLKYRVFRDLWKRGKFVTNGEAFGADFLVYPNDPMIYHASHIVIIQESAIISPLELIAKVRLAVTVNKSCVFAYEQEDKDDDDEENEKSSSSIVYQTIAWCKAPPPPLT